MRRYVTAGIVLILAAAAALLCGNSAIGAGNVLRTLAGNGTRAQQVIVFQVRLPRIAAALLSGAALSVSGYLLQNNLNNAVASPGLLGINNGAGLFVLISALVFPYQAGMKCVMAFAGALAVTLLVSLLSSGTGLSKTSVILSGVAVSAVCVAAADVIISVRPETVADKTAFQLGGFGDVSLTTVSIAAPVIVTMLALAFVLAGGMDLMALGDEVAQGLGVRVRMYRLIYLLCASLLAGAAVSMSGMIGFVGLMVPNLVRMVHHGKSRGGIALCMMVGSTFLLLCDTLARVIVFPYELPCGLLLSALGAPFLIWMLVRKRKRLGVND